MFLFHTLILHYDWQKVNLDSDLIVFLGGAPDIDGLITEALLIGDYEAAVGLCLHDNRMADSIILAIAGGPELLAKTQKKYFTKTQSKISKVRLYKTTDVSLMCSQFFIFCTLLLSSPYLFFYFICSILPLLKVFLRKHDRCLPIFVL